MNRRKLIIFSATGIVCVLIALLSVTYGYYATQIMGNTNRNSIYVTSTTLALEYSEDEDSNITLESIEPGVTSSKTFTIKNVGNDVVDDYGIYLEEVINTFNRTEDLKITLTCKEYNASGTLIGDCNGIDTVYPTTNMRLVTNSIDVGYTHEYTFTFEYEYLTDIDQSEDKAKTLSGLIQVYNEPDVIDITGTVTGFSSGDYIEVTTDGKTSQILSDGTYRITALGLGQHTINLKSSDGTVKASKTIKINKDVSANPEASISADGTNIKIIEDSYEAIVNISVSGDTLSTNGVSIKEYNPFNETSLAYQIYQNKAQIQKYTKYGETYTENGTEINKSVKQLTTVTGIADGTNIDDNGLFKAQDDYGTSYIYRGSVKNNYVDFAGFTWRIVRINGDGSVRLILDGALDKTYQRLSNGTTSSTPAGSTSTFNSIQGDNAYVGYTYGQAGVTAGNGNKTAYDLTHEYTGDKTSDDKTGQSTIKQAVETFYKTYLYANYHGYISDTLFCGDKSLAKSGIGNVTTQLGYGKNPTYYAATERLFYSSGTTSIIEAKPTLKCVTDNTTLTKSQKAYSRYTVSGNEINEIKTNDDLIYPIALLSADELVMSGAFKSKKNLQYYLYNSSTTNSYWWTMSPYYFGDSYAGVFTHVFHLSLSTYSVGSSNGVRPVINLSYEKTLYDNGTGTSDDPYTVKLSET